jgi:redox-sensing transcriptional repressor
MTPETIPDIVIGRLPLYLRALTQFEASGDKVTSSHEMGDHLGISSAQIRKDLLHFGEFGKQGTGYNVSYLKEQLEIILRVNQEWDVALVGAGGVGNAIVNYAGFRGRGFRIAVVFDNDPNKVGQKIDGLVILSSDQIKTQISKMGIRIAMVAVPSDQAQEVTNKLVKSGVESILNYAPTSLIVPPKVRIQHIDPVVGLQHMTYYL